MNPHTHSPVLEEKMALFGKDGKSSLDISASIISAQQHVRVALEVFYGCEVAFIDTLRVNATKVIYVGEMKRRTVTLTGNILITRDGNLSKLAISASCEMWMMGMWRSDECHIGLGPSRDELRDWLEVQCKGHFAFPLVRVGQALGRPDKLPSPTVWIGTNHLDRNEVSASKMNW